MPPYSAVHEDPHAACVHNDDPLVDVPMISKQNSTDSQDSSMAVSTTTKDTTTALEEEDTGPSFMDKLLDFNPCMGGMGSAGTSAFGNPSPSAVFKTRTCAECGSKCTKFQGYKKEEIIKKILVTDEETGEETEIEEKVKVYYQNDCYKLKGYRQQHKEDGYQNVMDDLLEYFRELELEAERKRLEEERKQREEEELRRIQAEKAAAEKKAADDAARLAAEEEEATRIAAEEGLTKRASIMENAKNLSKKKKERFLKSFKKSNKKKKEDDTKDETDADKSESKKKEKKSFSLLTKKKKSEAADDDTDKTSNVDVDGTTMNASGKKKKNKFSSLMMKSRVKKGKSAAAVPTVSFATKGSDTNEQEVSFLVDDESASSSTKNKKGKRSSLAIFPKKGKSKSDKKTSVDDADNNDESE